jgi:hypothetical protein
MKNIYASVTTSILGSILILVSYSTPAVFSRSQVVFYCGRTQDGNLDPATLMGVRGIRGVEHRTIVVWRENTGSMTPLQRCEIVSRRFQQAWDRGNFQKLVPGVDRRTGSGLICAVSGSNDPCQLNRVLFTVKTERDAKEITERLRGTMNNNSGTPIYQSSTAESIDMQELIDSILRQRS